MSMHHRSHDGLDGQRPPVQLGLAVVFTTSGWQVELSFTVGADRQINP